MTKKSVLLSLTTLAVLSVMAVGCSDALDLIVPDLQGTWLVQMDNPDQATFSGCTGAVMNLEGVSFNAGMSLQPICAVTGSLDVLQVKELVTFVGTQIGCSDGSTAILTGTATVTGTDVSGFWTAVSTQSITSTYTYAGTVSGNTIDLQEADLVFAGGLQGACDLSPNLDAIVTVQ